ncbi:hypothetical protein [Streptomyces yaizuensis]|uniref:Uncharacterized protein n=1 Tax=Streptomyces yaizuensis TaxID=2989713 RepID=A0ABQ5NYY3_9ACTN|nr:hypothetical protein [Streptomyces sp. YSPA8]GLF95561.1 hypothetical protein SYYSPA8_14710 [Streptomyces sp. YSPA8]
MEIAHDLSFLAEVLRVHHFADWELAEENTIAGVHQEVTVDDRLLGFQLSAAVMPSTFPVAVQPVSTKPSFRMPMSSPPSVIRSPRRRPSTLRLGLARGVSIWQPQLISRFPRSPFVSHRGARSWL